MTGRPVTEGLDVVADGRRLVAHRAHGATRIVIMVQETVEALLQAVDAGQYALALGLARRVLLECAAIRSSAGAGALTWTADEITHDPFAGLDDAGTDTVCALLAEGAAVDRDDTARPWSDEVRRFVDETERMLGYDDPLPSILRPDGIYPALRIAREVGVLVDGLRLPPLPFPDSWREQR